MAGAGTGLRAAVASRSTTVCIVCTSAACRIGLVSCAARPSSRHRSRSPGRRSDVSITTVEEQRGTDWMRFQSLSDYLDPADHSRTVEGLPAPMRAVIVARKP